MCFEITIPYHHTPFYRLVQFQEFLLKLKKHCKTCKTAPIKVCNEVGDDDDDVEDNDDDDVEDNDDDDVRDNDNEDRVTAWCEGKDLSSVRFNRKKLG